MKLATSLCSGVAIAAIVSLAPFASAQSPSNVELLARIENLEAQNAALMARLDGMIEDSQIERVPASDGPEVATDTLANRTGFVSADAAYGFDVLDAAEHVNKKPIIQLKARAEDRLATPLTISGSIIGIANYQDSNRDSKFGYLMRNPTSANQIGDHVSEALIHSAQLGFTANFSDWLTGYAEILYNPQQNFGPGTITGRDRNQLLMQRAYLMIGDLDRSPVFGVVGKVDIPFGLNDTVSPFTNSTSWHSFAGLAYGAQLGYVDENLMIRAMAIQGGAQFRAANAPVEGTVVPSRINNFAVDANYTFNFNEADWMMLGASYQHGSAYCQNYPIFHFNPCDDNNPAWAAYAQGSIGNLELLGEFAETTDVWPGSAVPIPTNPLSVFDAQKTRSWTVGGRYGFGDTLLSGKRDHYISLEFSKFRAGEEGAPWERQNQFVLGYSRYLIDNVNLFAEAIHVDGFAPLNFLTGGNFPDGSTWSDNDAKTEVILIGAHTAF
ncbi:hypothetical protein [Henriciella algicola]|uniref:Porin n=1 Tax=Henriciella algicola TaxID=1608422 RepID=A0A399RKK4_9PROT|nr:hypothetical protein [Henriciella algicola]RIJ31211.1 hypothetical protein D1222_02810 [Henriciella algicola]